MENESKLHSKNWIQTRIKVAGYPKTTVADKYDMVINVSDEFPTEIPNTEYHWCPMNECTDNMGLNSIFAALTLLYRAETSNKSVLLHCHAGVNRSVTVFQLYYEMRTNEKYIPHKPKRELNLDSMFVDQNGNPQEPVKLDHKNQMEFNQLFGHLPVHTRLKVFLKLLNEALESGKPASLDSIKLKSQLQ